LFCEIVAGGCGSGAPRAESSMTEASVTGTVSEQGKPVTQGKVISDPSNVNRKAEVARSADIRKDGTYEVKTLIGANRVTVSIPAKTMKKGSSPYVQRICDVQAGSNTFDITLP